MEAIQRLNDRIIRRVNANLRELKFDAHKFVYKNLDYDKLLKFYAFYGITAHHPISFEFITSNLSGSYFLGKCLVSRSTIYKSDVRGDELKRKGDCMDEEKSTPLMDDEVIAIRDSILYKTLVHNHSHNMESPEEFAIRNTISAHYANIHGSTIMGSFLGAFATVDLMDLHSCVVGEFSYIQVGELFHKKIPAGTVWVKHPDFEIKYKFNKKILTNYVGVNKSGRPMGKIYDFVLQREKDYEHLFEVVNMEKVKTPKGSSVNRYAVVKKHTSIGKNVLVSQRAFVENSVMEDGSNAQENSYIINSHLRGMNITAHGGKIIESDVGKETFVGFNSFLYGKHDARITIGKGCIILPHTIIDTKEPITIPDYHLVWGFIESAEDLASNMISFEDLGNIKKTTTVGKMKFSGSGAAILETYKARISHILLDNGAFFQDDANQGHAQMGQDISFNILQPYRNGENMGLYPSLVIQP